MAHKVSPERRHQRPMPPNGLDAHIWQKSFERMSSGDLGEEIKKALAESEDADTEGSMDMVKMFFADMSYKQTYHFPDADIKKNSNALGEISADGHTLTVNIKPFDEEQLKQKVTVATELKLK
jgi:hypothetical protein